MTLPHSQPDSATGFAIFSFGQLDVATVSPTRRGALVNWLVTSAGQRIYRWTTDEEIELLWLQFRHPDNEWAEVLIKRVEPRP